MTGLEVFYLIIALVMAGAVTCAMLFVLYMILKGDTDNE